MAKRERLTRQYDGFPLAKASACYQTNQPAIGETEAIEES